MILSKLKLLNICKQVSAAQWFCLLLCHCQIKKLPRYPIPVFLLAQLAVHKEFHGGGLGKVSLIKALEYLWEINSHMRAYAIVVDCLTEQAESFYAKYGFEVLCEINGRVRMFIPMKTVGQLFT